MLCFNHSIEVSQSHNQGLVQWLLHMFMSSQKILYDPWAAYVMHAQNGGHFQAL